MLKLDEKWFNFLRGKWDNPSNSCWDILLIETSQNGQIHYDGIFLTLKYWQHLLSWLLNFNISFQKIFTKQQVLLTSHGSTIHIETRTTSFSFCFQSYEIALSRQFCCYTFTPLIHPEIWLKHSSVIIYRDSPHIHSSQSEPDAPPSVGWFTHLGRWSRETLRQ